MDKLLLVTGALIVGILGIKLLFKLVFWFFDSTHLSNMKSILPEEDYKLYEADYKRKGGIKGLSGH